MRYLTGMQRLLLALALMATPAAGWEATIGKICTLSHSLPDGRVELTFDPSGPLYSITVTRAGDPWSDAPAFAMSFEGTRPNTISTDRHKLSDGDTALTVTDRGFGNVLDDHQFNNTATAFSGEKSVEIPLDGAAPEVEKFRACSEAGLV